MKKNIYDLFRGTGVFLITSRYEKVKTKIKFILQL